ncbi:HopJ type III effector protein [Winogradskyella psychrotolerans]|uniref:HopJ type III effector protein n=1 Tax=Winogradskyella psychrotolerans TaxID=1344585 RepID=UPI001C075B71|nr:HopJ type III effector protein [Winogradskyella psychrotolerans]MBU2926633.1 HopJ type III effector protein [Winogradskyella psychrotolerans]
MTVDNFLTKLKSSPKQINFSETMAVIDSNYLFKPTAFTNGSLKNAEDQNLGSCKLLSFAVDQKLTIEETLACFGSYYFEDVLLNPEGTGHQNIRNFIKTGFEGLRFETFPLEKS